VNDDDDDYDENKPVWPTRAVGVLSGVRDVETYNNGRPSQRALREKKQKRIIEASAHFFSRGGSQFEGYLLPSYRIGSFSQRK
jgi:hypothetical protein